MVAIEPSRSRSVLVHRQCCNMHHETKTATLVTKSMMVEHQPSKDVARHVPPPLSSSIPHHICACMGFVRPVLRVKQ